MCTKYYNESVWYARTQRDFGVGYAERRPCPVMWFRHYLEGIATNYKRGNKFSRKAIRNIHFELDSTMSSLCEIALDGDVGTAKFQVSRERERFNRQQIEGEERTNEVKEYTIDTKENNSILHYAVLSGNIDLAEYILSEAPDYVNRKDLVTNFSPFHYAMFAENIDMMDLLIRHNAEVEMEDSFNGQPFDYARMLGLLPSFLPPSPSHLRVYNRQHTEVPSLELWDIQKIERHFNITFCNQIRCTHDYIVELMFSGFQIEKDEAFREKYAKQIYETSGDENVVLTWISDEVGWGVYAAKDFNSGDYILRYGGDLIPEDKVKNRSYNMMVSFEDFVLSAWERRNMGGFVNHSPNFNAETQCIFERGAEQAVITATEFIPKGKQILIDYSSSYWGQVEQGESETVVPLGLSESFPTFLPDSVITQLDQLK